MEIKELIFREVILVSKFIQLYDILASIKASHFSLKKRAKKKKKAKERKGKALFLRFNEMLT